MIDPVTEYATQIVNGDILAGEELIQDCQRHLDDLKRQDTDGFPYHFDIEKANGVLEYAKFVPEPDSGKPQPLMLWQKFILGSINGWRNTETGGKRFRRGIVSISRAQGKTYLASIQATYDYFVSSAGKSNQDILIAANTTKQTTKLFNYVKATAEMLLNGVFKSMKKTIRPREYDIVDRTHKNQIVRQSADGGKGKFDSYHAVTAIFDEAGDQRDTVAFGKITSGQIMIPEAIFLQISTAYPNPNSPLREDIKHISEDIAKGGAVDTFLAVWAQDNVDEVFKPDTWIKSNPLLGLPEKKAALLSGLISERDSKMRAGELDSFIVKNMNVWLNAKQDAAFKLEDIERCIIPEFDMDGRPVFVGFDNSMTSDDATIAFVFPYHDENGSERWHLFQHSFIPWHKAGSIEAKERVDGMNYRNMQELGFADVTTHVRGLISNDYLYEWAMDFVEKHNLDVQSLCYDWAHTSALINAWDANTDWPIQAVRQGTLTLNEPTKWLQDAIVDERVSMLDDPMLQKCLLNAVIVSDNNGIKLNKNYASFKIDAADAIVDALSEAIHYFENEITGVSF